MKVQQSTRISISNIRMPISGTSRTISVSNNRTKVEQGHKYKGNTIYGYKHISILGDYNQILTSSVDVMALYERMGLEIYRRENGMMCPPSLIDFNSDLVIAMLIWISLSFPPF